MMSSSGDGLADCPTPAANRRFGRVIDCGFVLSEHSAQWPTCKPLCREVHKSPESTQAGGARNKQSFTLNGGSGTHIDAPSHFVPGGRTVDQLLPEELADVPLEVVDVSGAVAADPDFACTASAILQHESRHGMIPSGELVQQPLSALRSPPLSAAALRIPLLLLLIASSVLLPAVVTTMASTTSFYIR